VLTPGAEADAARHVPEELVWVEVPAQAVTVGAVLAQQGDAGVDGGSDVDVVRRVAPGPEVGRWLSLGEYGENQARGRCG
jgi:hypothetical protein